MRWGGGSQNLKRFVDLGECDERHFWLEWENEELGLRYILIWVAWGRVATPTTHPTALWMQMTDWLRSSNNHQQYHYPYRFPVIHHALNSPTFGRKPPVDNPRVVMLHTALLQLRASLIWIRTSKGLLPERWPGSDWSSGLTFLVRLKGATVGEICIPSKFAQSVFSGMLKVIKSSGNSQWMDNSLRYLRT